MATITINCEMCGTPRETKYKNTKYCRECRFLVNLTYAHKMKKCAGCGSKFQPIARNDELCGEHLYESPHKVVCAFCNKTDNSVFEDLRVCSVCARDPLRRKAFIAALEKRCTERRDRNDGDLLIGST